MSDSPSIASSLWQRFRQMLGPFTGAAILDGLDMATFGQLGFFIGGIIGAGATWLICTAEGISLRTRLILCSLAALYCAFPFTEFIPLATIILAAVRFFKTPVQAKPASQ